VTDAELAAARLAALLDAERENTALRAELGKERAAVVDYLTWRAEMTHYNDAAREFVNAAQEVSDGVHHTIDYDEEEP
jgi:hypothetical protein